MREKRACGGEHLWVHEGAMGIWEKPSHEREARAP